jgi:uncharacterized protein YqgC (DUF456 family)
MDIVLVVLGLLLCIAGILGCFLPILPGPPLNWIALLLLNFTTKAQVGWKFLIIWAVVTILTIVLDSVIPVLGTKKLGGTNRGVWGSVIGLVVGLFIFPPFGIIIGPFVGAVLGELSSGQDFNKAFKAGLGSFLGFLAGTVIKLAVSGVMTFYFVKNALRLIP